MPPIKIANPKLAVELVEELQEEPAYANPKAYAATHAFLQSILHFSKDQQFAYVPAKYIKEQFSNYNINYKPCLNALVEHGIIQVNRQYIVGAKTRGYKLTKKGVNLMYTGQMQYLLTLLNDPNFKRKLQKRRNYVKTHGQLYKTEFLQYIHDGRMQYLYYSDAANFIHNSTWPTLTKLHATTTLIDFQERKFTELKYNDSDNRVWNEFVGMKSELRRYFNHGELKYRYVMDIRSCHPLFLAHYLVHRAKRQGWQAKHPLLPGNHHKTIVQIDSARKREQSERLSFINSTTASSISLSSISNNSPTSINNTSTINALSHYDGGNLDILAELTRWNAIFCDPSTDPKAILIRELGYTRVTAKAALNQSINGSRKYRKFVTWFKTNFPLLHRVWERTDSATVGNGISSYYETELMQDMDLYRLATDLGLHLTYEYDGCGIMCKDDDTEVLSKIKTMINHIQERSQRLWRIRPVVVVKTAAGELVDMTNQAALAETATVTAQQPAATPANRTVACAFQRSSGRSGRPNRKSRGSSRPSKT